MIDHTPDEGAVEVIHQDQKFSIRFPSAQSALPHISRIVTGQEYPIVRCGFRPERIVDIGANVGAAAFFFSRVYPEADYFCYEPSLVNFSYLRSNTSGFQRFRVFNYGLSDRSGKSKLFIGRDQYLQNSLYENREVQDKFEEIELRKASTELHPVLFGKRCLLKIDTEGCELPILREIQNDLEHIDILYLEYHSESDRREVDELISSHLSLWWSQASIVNRGNIVYLSSRLLSEWPQLADPEIRH